MTKFLTKNADTALVEIKEKLYERLAILRPFIIDEYGPIDLTEAAIFNEIKFLEELLDLIERS